MSTEFVSKEQYDELARQMSEFSLALSALVVKHGIKSPENIEINGYQYILRLEDFKAVSDALVQVDHHQDLGGERGTVVTVTIKDEDIAKEAPSGP